MREQWNGPSSLKVKKKVNVKSNGKDESAEGRRGLNNSTGSYGESSGGGKPILTNNLTSNNVALATGGRLKVGNSLQGRQNNQNLVFDNSGVTEDGSDPFGNEKSTADEGTVLPHWGCGKRSRGSRYEPSKHAASVVGLADKSTVRSEKAASLPALKLRTGPSKLKSSKTSPNRLLPRNSLVNNRADGFVHSNSNSNSPSSKQNGGEAKERASDTERAWGALQRSTVGYRGIRRQLQGDNGFELATATIQGHAQNNMQINDISNCASLCNGQSLNHTDNITCNSFCEPLALACRLKFPVDFLTLEWPRIVIALTRKEKEEDFLAFKGSKLPHRPKKRPKVVERALHYCTPGNWLIDLSHGRYDVREKKSARKKPRGLKAMESLESEAE